MAKSFYHYQQTDLITQEVLAWVADPASHGCDALLFSANASLSPAASAAIVGSHLAATVESMEFNEIFFSVEQLAALLTMPALVKLEIFGGVSSDWAGPEYVWPTLEVAAIDWLCTDPNAQKLRVLIIDKQQMGEHTGNALRRALPNLQTLSVEGIGY